MSKPRFSAKNKATPPSNFTPKTVSTEITKLDSLAQGVSRVDDMTTFISKTLPNEICDIRITKQSKGVQFAQLINVTQASPLREESQCEHFEQCSGCHYLHTSYEQELEFKKIALTNYLRPLTKNVALKNFEAALEKLVLTPSSSRFEYRNRIQLHYKAKDKKIGFINGLTDEIVEIPNCQLINKELRPALEEVYKLDKFPKPPEQKDRHGKIKKNSKGHCEIYLKKDGENSQVETNWNQAYSQGGFTQVNAEINDKLIQRLTQLCAAHEHETILDLFSGEGNLSDPILKSINKPSAIRHMIDLSPVEHDDFIRLNLYNEDTMHLFSKMNTCKQYDLMIVDPPRKGFPDLNKWIYKYKPKQLLYVSCYPASLARDIAQLAGKFKIEHLELLDMFPGTHHFETLVNIRFIRHSK